jgi:alkylation response protein AidB-like acyl-CoA dehydrogenase
MDFRDTPEEAAFRKELRAWIADNLPVGWRERGPRAGGMDEGFARVWSKALYDAGYSGLTWPKAYGGRGAPYTHQAIFLEESARGETPEHIGVIGLGMAGPTIIAHGTDQQKSAHLSKILSGEEVWCQGFSEPGSGSDLASLRTRATDAGDPEFNEIFFNDVKVPKTNVVGEANAGWNVAMTTLLHERGTLGFALTARLEVAVAKLIRLAKETGASEDPLVRDRVARQWIELQALKFTNYRALTTLMKTGVPGPEGSIAKLHWSGSNQRLGALAIDILGARAQLDGDDAVWNGYWQYQQLRSRGNTIEAGTSEILRNIVAERVLGLPRSR